MNPRRCERKLRSVRMSAPRKASLFFFACFFPRPVAWKESLAIWPPPELSHVFCLCASSHAEKRKRLIAFGRSGAKSLQAPFSCRRGCLPSARSFFLFRHILDRRGGGRSGMDDVCRRFDAAARDSDDGHYNAAPYGLFDVSPDAMSTGSSGVARLS